MACYAGAVETTAAILLRRRRYSDSSLIVSWCTESLGCIHTIAKGALRQKSAFAGKLDLFFEADIQIARSRRSSLHTLTEVDLRHVFAGIRREYLRTQTAAYFVELVEFCTERDHHEPELFSLLHRAFAFLDAREANPAAVTFFESELARIAGVQEEAGPRSEAVVALGNLFGKIPPARAPLLKTLSRRPNTAGPVIIK
jgi:DNA repair protein RecO (recombination protein O)